MYQDFYVSSNLSIRKKKSENFQLIWNFISTNNSFQMNAALQGAFVKQK